MKLKKSLACMLAIMLVAQVTVCFAGDLSSSWVNAADSGQLVDFKSIRDKQLKFAAQYDYHEGDFDKSFTEYPGILYTSGIEYRENGTEFECPAIYVDYHAALVNSYELTQSNVKLVVNEQPYTAQNKCAVYNSRTLVPVEVFSLAGCEVSYDTDSLVCTIKKDNITLEILPYLIGMRKNQQNGFYVPLEVCARIIDGLLYVPIRAVAEEFDLSIVWNAETNTVYLK